MSNYATKTDLKSATEFDTSSFPKNFDWANLKSDADKLDIDKLKNVPIGLSSFRSKVDKLDVNKLVSVPFDLGKQSDIIKKCCWKRCI